MQYKNNKTNNKKQGHNIDKDTFTCKIVFFFTSGIVRQNFEVI